MAADELADRWEDLADRVAAPPFLRPGWVFAWQKAFRRGPLQVLTVDSSDGVRAVLPLERRAFTVGNPVNWHTPVAGIVADEWGRGELCDALLVGRRVPVELRFLIAGSTDVAAFRDSAHRAHARLVERPLLESVHLALDGRWDAVQARLPAKLRSDVRRRRRRLSEVGDVDVAVVDGRGDLDAVLREAFRVEASGWKGKRGTAIGSSASTIRFYTDVAHWAASRDLLRLGVLRVDGRLVAFQYLLDADGVRYYVKGGYDERFNRFSPGKLLLHGVLEDAARRGLRRFEFLGRREPYKDEWASDTTELVELRACPPTVSGALDALVHTRVRPAARRVVSKTVRWREKRTRTHPR